MAADLVERAWRESTPETVEHDLAALWRDLARRSTVARAVMSNLVVFRFHERRAQPRTSEAAAGESAFAEMMDAVVARHPSRAIVIEHDRGEHATAPPLGAGVGVSVFGPPTARYGVESIVVRSACAEASLPSIVRQFLRGGIPTSIWWTEDLSVAPPLESLVSMGRQLVYDSRHWRDLPKGIRAVSSLVAEEGTDVADLNWRRLRPLRDALVHVAPGCGQSAVRPDRVQIRHATHDAALAWLLAGWLAAKLHWPAEWWPEIADTATGGELLELDVRGPDVSLTAALNDHRIRVDVTGRPPLVVPAARETEADAIAAELRTLPREAELCAALRANLARL